MHVPRKPWWQQATAVVSLGAGGAVTGLHFAPSPGADIQSPSHVQVRLMALQQAAAPAPSDDATLRSAIVNVATYYLRMAAGKTPAEMEELIWQRDSTDGVDHGQSCGAFASLTLELAAEVVGRQSWVTGGTSYPWPLHKWVDARVDPNPASLGVTSVLQDAEAHHRWHPLGDGYTPLPGDWVLFDGHVEVVTKYADGVLSTIGGDSLPNFSVNAHTYSGSLSSDGVAGFVNNGDLSVSAARQATGSGKRSGSQSAERPGRQTARPAAASGSTANSGSTASAPNSAGGATEAEQAESPDDAVIPGMPTSLVARPDSAGDSGSAQDSGSDGRAAAGQPSSRPASNDNAAGRHGAASRAGGQATRRIQPAAARHPGGGSAARGSASGAGASTAAAPDTSAIPGLPAAAPGLAAGARASAKPGSAAARSSAASPGSASGSSTSSAGSDSAGSAPTGAPETSTEREFIRQIAPGALRAQRQYGVPASVTIAQAIDESGWGSSALAANDHNLFGVKGSGPAGSAGYPTQEYENGEWVTINAPFAVYHDAAQSITAHGELLGTADAYAEARNYSQDPDAFASALTGVYATDPAYGAKLISLMQRYNLYRYDNAPAAAPAPAAGTPSDASAARSRLGSGSGPTASPSPAAPKRPSPVASAPASSSSSSPQPTATPSSSSSSPQPTATPSSSSSSPQPTAAPSSGVSSSSPQPTAAPSSAAVSAPAQPVSGGAARSAGSAAGLPRAAAPGGAEIPGIQQPAQADRATQSVSARPLRIRQHPAQPASANSASAHRSAEQSPSEQSVSARPLGTRSPSVHLGAARPASARKAPAQQASAQHGSAQHGSAQPASAQHGSAQPASAQPASAQPGSARRAPAQHGSAQQVSAQPVSARLMSAESVSMRPAADLTAAAASTSAYATPAYSMSARPEPVRVRSAPRPARGSAEPARPAGAAAPAAASAAHEARPAQPTRAAQAARPPQSARSPRAARSAQQARPAQPPRRPQPAGSANPAGSRSARGRSNRYQAHVPAQLASSLTVARLRLGGAKPLYQDVASYSGIGWELLAACDWMQCEARPGYSPVHGEKLGTLNEDRTIYQTKSAALEQCAEDLAELSWAVYGIDVTSDAILSVRELANVFAAFRWGGLLRLHHTSAMEFPYSVAGLTGQHLGMRWPKIADSRAPDKPGSRFRMAFGAVPLVLGLDYPATV